MIILSKFSPWMWWEDGGEGDEGKYDEYKKQRQHAHHQRLLSQMNEGLLGGYAETCADAHTFITEHVNRAFEKKTDKPRKGDFVNFIGRANVRETIRIGTCGAMGGGSGRAIRARPDFLSGKRNLSSFMIQSLIV